MHRDEDFSQRDVEEFWKLLSLERYSMPELSDNDHFQQLLKVIIPVKTPHRHPNALTGQNILTIENTK